MVSINYFGQMVQEILQNNHLKTNFKTQKSEILFPLFAKVGNFLMRVSRTVNVRELNKAILKSSH